jgi:transposase
VTTAGGADGDGEAPLRRPPQLALLVEGGARKGGRGGRPPGVDRQRYKQRNQVERLMNRRKQFRAVATRFDKLGCRYKDTCARNIP